MTMSAFVDSHCRRHMRHVCLETSHFQRMVKCSKSLHDCFWYNPAAISTGLRHEQQCGKRLISTNSTASTLLWHHFINVAHGFLANIDVCCQCLPLSARACNCVAFAKLYQASEAGMHVCESRRCFFNVKSIFILFGI